MKNAPEVDGVVYLVDGEAAPGDLVSVEITEAHPYDLVGRVVAGFARSRRKVRTPRAGCWVTPRRSDPTPAQQKAYRRWPERDQARVKWRGKSPPRLWRHGWPASVTWSKAK